MKADYTLKLAELGVARDSIDILVNKTKTQDTIIQKYDSVLVLKDTVINLKNNIITQRDLQIVDLNKNARTLKNQRDGAIAGGVLGVILGIVLAIVF